MLSLVLSTVVFFVAAYLLNRHLDQEGLDRGMLRKILVGMVATVVSVGAGWALDKLDGNANTPGKNPPIADVRQNGDPAKILKALSGIE